MIIVGKEPRHQPPRQSGPLGGTEDKETINKRLRRALEEMELVEEYDYLVINDTVEQATEDMLTIVAAEKMKCSRNKNIKKIFKGEM